MVLVLRNSSSSDSHLRFASKVGVNGPVLRFAAIACKGDWAFARKVLGLDQAQGISQV